MKIIKGPDGETPKAEAGDDSSATGARLVIGGRPLTPRPEADPPAPPAAPPPSSPGFVLKAPGPPPPSAPPSPPPPTLAPPPPAPPPPAIIAGRTDRAVSSPPVEPPRDPVRDLGLRRAEDFDYGAPRTIDYLPGRLPPDVESFSTKLQHIRQGVTEQKRVSDGLFLGIGLDGAIGLIPVAGAIYTIFAGLRLVMMAHGAKCSGGVKRFCYIVFAIDVIVGLFVGPGDIIDLLFRSHAWAADRILREVEMKLELIDDARAYSYEAAAHHLPEYDHERLRDMLYRDGKTRNQVWIGLLIPAGLILLLLAMCQGG